MWKRLKPKQIRSNTKPRAGIDRWLIISLIILSGFGLIAVYNASVVRAFREFDHDPFYFIRNQSIYLLVGVIGALIISRIHFRVWYKLAVPMLVIILILLSVVLIPGIGTSAQGAKRWFYIGGISLQPTELSKLALVVYLSAWFSNKEKKRFLPFLTLLLIIIGLIILQPDLGTAVIIMSICISLYFLSGAPIGHFAVLLSTLFLATLGFAFSAPYRRARVLTFLNPSEDLLGASYHIRQILIALGSGGLWGLGIGKSRQKYEYLPEANTDSIFAIIGEELGFLGALGIVGLYIFIVIRGFLISQKIKDRFGQLLGSGIIVWFAVQSLINLASIVALVPLTGVPLPLVSYGGSSLVTMWFGFGILFNISRFRHLPNV